MTRLPLHRVVAAAVITAALGTAAPAVADVYIPTFTRPKAVTPAEVRFQNGIAALDKRDLAGAETAFRDSIKLDAKAPGPWLGLAQIALNRGDKNAAEEHFKRAAALAPTSAAIQLSLGQYLYSQRELPDAEAALRKAAQIDPQGVGAPAHVKLGDLYLVAFGKPNEAIKEYQAAITIEPNNAGAQYALGLAYLSSGDAARGEAAITRASLLSPNNPLPYQTLGRIYTAQKQNAKALDTFARAIKVAPSFAAPHLDRGQIFAAMGDDDKALKEYASALANDPKLVGAMVATGMVHQRNQRWADAEKAYLDAIKVEPRAAVAYNNLAWMAAERRTDLTRAAGWAQKAVALAPKQPEFQVTLAWVYRAQGNTAKAEQVLRTAAAATPNRALTLFYLGQVRLEQGKVREGAADLKRALDVDASFPGADIARQRLKDLGQS
jgi:tetratricopeptide (TPR) repeat protein